MIQNENVPKTIVKGKETMKPKLRFKGFVDEWEEKKLEDISDVRDGTHESPKFVQEGYPLVTSKNLKNGKLDYSDINYISKQDYERINKRSYVEDNDILIAMIGTIGNPVKVIKDRDFAIKNVALIKDKQKQNNYLIHYLQSNNIKKQFLLELSGGTQKFISLSTIRKIKIQLPSTAEQEKISHFFYLLDQRIEKQERKVELLEEEKKGYMQKIFLSKSDKWEEKKLGEIVSFKNNKRKPITESNRHKGKYPYYGATGIIDYINDYLFDEICLLVGEDGADWSAYSNTAFIASGKYWVNNHAHVITSKYIDLYFLRYLLNFMDLRKWVCGNAPAKLNLESFKNIMIQFPSLPEQEKIGNFFSLLDKRIEKEKEKLQIMKQEKKGYMQRMFI